MDKNLNLIFTIDKSYVQHFTTALISVVENNKNIDLSVFVIHDIDDISLLDNVISFFYQEYKLKISLLSLEGSLFKSYPITHHVSKATYFRLLIADIIPKNIDKAIFLDSDLIVTGSLEELISLDLKNNYLLAINEPNFVGMDVLNKIGIPAKTYFNAGVMILNLKAWRENNVTQDLVLTAKKYMDKLIWWDQDVLNIYFFNKWGELAPQYNTKEIKKRLDVLPVIIHYAGESKPWHFLNHHPYKDQYWKYLQLSPYKNFGYQDISIKRIIKRMVFFYRYIH
ncbi:MAG: glycosyl hydrolase [Mucilaginibacter sp.]|nr:glycosyl hydrolase [Mucilaginibacter sp.]